ncbi:AraC family transcriptional regulator [uncultured Aquimarina sp.]|uniref:AraC family transcriptional regulator n=1 Tax=uncultured Aquimarina sp. TaxID=575652 RepID=UPI002610190D|nr:AraC family transcriptional regulator [uncultured Aquimarina sp.]
MKIQKLFFCIILIFFLKNILLAQNPESKTIDSLIQLDFEELYEKQFSEKDLHKNRIIAEAYLRKAKDLDSISEMARGYFWISFMFSNEYEKQIIYIDSAIAKVKNTKHVLQTGAMYNSKGGITQLRGDYNRALQYYLEGLKNSEKMNAWYYISIFRSKIAALKRKLGKYDEAKAIYKKCLKYEKEQIGKKVNDSLRYLMTLQELVSTYRLNKEIDSAYYFHNFGIKMSQNTDIKGVYTLNEGIFQYYNKDYDLAILSLENGVKQFLRSKYKISYGYHNLIDGYFYLGKSHNLLNQRETALGYFKKIDSIVQLSNDLISESRPAYLEMIEYYKSIRDVDNQLHFINKLLYNDSILTSRYRSTSDKLIKEFDTPNLISEKENLINRLKKRNDTSSYIIIGSIVIIIIVFFVFLRSHQRSRIYKRRFKELIKEKNEKENEKKEIIIDKRTTDISKDVVNMILEELNKFEENKGFLEINLTTGKMAKKINTNSKYLSQIIKLYRNKNFTSYINDLRIDEIVERLKLDKKLRKYTIKALAYESGFNSAEVFSKSFHKRTGIYPSYFIKQLNN